jgi:hypothetical protein
MSTHHSASSLSLKTRIVPIKQFIDQELVDPGEIERSSRVEKIRALLDQILFESGYSVGEDDLLDRDKDRAVRENLIDLFEECVSRTLLHLGLARYLLRRATRCGLLWICVAADGEANLAGHDRRNI